MTIRSPFPARRRRPASQAASARPREEALSSSRLVGEERDGRHARAVIWTLLCGLVAFVTWASLTPVYEIVSGDGHIRPEGVATRIEHLDGGRVEAVAVAEGDVVARGDMLVRLAQGDLRAERAKSAARMEILDGEIGRHEALLELDLAGGAAPRPRELLSGLDPAFAEEIGYRLAQIEAIRARRAVTAAREAALGERRVKLAEELGILRAQAGRYAGATDPTVFTRREIEDLDREVIGLERAIAEVDGEILVLAATAAQTVSEEDELVASYRRDAAMRLGDLRERRVEVEQTLIQIDDRLERTVMRAPIGGTVGQIAIRGAGEIVGPGEIIMEIVPDAARLYAEVEVAADRIGGVARGQEASLKVLTYDYTRFGEIAAVVEQISPSSYADEDGRSVFRLRLSVLDEASAGHLGPFGPHGAISPGMTVIADIRSGRRTILSYLVRPARIAADRAFTEA